MFTSYSLFTLLILFFVHTAHFILCSQCTSYSKLCSQCISYSFSCFVSCSLFISALPVLFFVENTFPYCPWSYPNGREQLIRVDVGRLLTTYTPVATTYSATGLTTSSGWTSTSPGRPSLEYRPGTHVPSPTRSITHAC